jgi:hypothetical protein
MKIVDCIWEQANLGCRVAEVSINAEESFPSEVLSDLETKFDYIVLKFAVANFQHYQMATSAQYVFIETQLSIKKKMAELILRPKEERLLNKFSAIEVTSMAELENVIRQINSKMFVTDRIYLDPVFGSESSVRRYQNWTRSAFEQGAIALRYFYHDKEIGFGLVKIEKNTLFGLLGGAYDGEGMGIIVPLGPLFIKNKGFEWFRTKISMNNTPVLQLYNHFNFEITNTEYVFVKHIKH